MISPKPRPDISDKPTRRGRQPYKTDNPVGIRLIEALDGQSRAWLSGVTGISESTLGDYVQKGIASADAAVRIAHAVGRSVDWLLTGEDRGPAHGAPLLVSVEDADFVNLPRYDLSNISEAGKGHRVESIPFRRDWLTRRVGTASGLWVMEMFASYEELGLFEGDAVICSDIARGILPPDNTICIFLGDGLFVARYRDRLVDDSSGPRVGPADLREHDVQPIARIRARMLAGI